MGRESETIPLRWKQEQTGLAVVVDGLGSACWVYYSCFSGGVHQK